MTCLSKIKDDRGKERLLPRGSDLQWRLLASMRGESPAHCRGRGLGIQEHEIGVISVLLEWAPIYFAALSAFESHLLPLGKVRQSPSFHFESATISLASLYRPGFKQQF